MHAIAKAGVDREIDALLPELARIAAEAEECDGAAIELFARDGESARSALHGIDEAAFSDLEVPRITSCDGAEPRVLHAKWVPALGFATAAEVPLCLDGAPIGMLCLLRGGPSFEASELAELSLLGDHLALEVERTRLDGARRRRTRQLSMLFDLARAGEEASALAPLIERVLLMSLDALGVDSAMIHALKPPASEDEGPLLVCLGFRARRPLSADRYRVLGDLPVDATTLSGRAALEGKTRVTGTDNWPSRTLPLLREGHVYHAAATPLWHQGRLIGTTCVVRRRDDPFSPDDLRLFESFAAQLAIAVDRARLIDDLRESVHELERAQERLVQRERLAALGELAASVAHEVRNPVGVIFNAIVALKRVVPRDGEGAQLLGIVHEEGTRLTHLVNELLDFARPAEPKVASYDLRALLASAAESATSEHGVPQERVQIVMDDVGAKGPDDTELEVELDARSFRQAIVNLIGNALEASNPGDDVIVRARPTGDAANAWVEIDVEDRGHGVDAKTAAHVFQPFFTTRAKGTGLGLAIVKRIVDAHHGTIALHPRPDGGTIFRVTIPQRHESTPPPPPTS